MRELLVPAYENGGMELQIHGVAEVLLTGRSGSSLTRLISGGSEPHPLTRYQCPTLILQSMATLT